MTPQEPFVHPNQSTSGRRAPAGLPARLRQYLIDHDVVWRRLTIVTARFDARAARRLSIELHSSPGSQGADSRGAVPAHAVTCASDGRQNAATSSER
ncbi:hypothetical protein EVAR_80907_1 [Eumeta japonica]|uniref:Uncharacterized protein n=1 Tax=Eumeta variegata TaxID=151549 RepID=A0A4C1V0V2_EUMVA|nr:hypothetical protein EVAR_80907_1 [Eumeta japonica]